MPVFGPPVGTFTDNFNRPDGAIGPDWQIRDGDTGALHPNDYAWNIVDDEVVAGTPDYDYAIYAGAVTPDQSIEVTLPGTAQFDPPRPGVIWLVCRYTPGVGVYSDYELEVFDAYGFAIQDGFTGLSLTYTAWDGNVYSSGFAPFPPSVLDGEGNLPVGVTVKLQASGTTITGYINGVLLGTLTGASLASGSVGFESDNVFSTVDNAVITGTQLSTPTTAIGSSVTPSAYGSSVTFTATVTGTSPNVPSGTVSFSVDGNPLPQNPITVSGMLGNDHVSSGSVVVSDVTVLTIGLHSVTASYSGDSHYNPSTASALSQQVSKLPSTVSVTSSSADAPLGVSVVFIATVMGLSPYANPTQTVTFFVDGVQFGSPVGLSPGPNSTATAVSNSISWNTHGSHQIYATYSGDSLYNTSTSGIAMQYAVISIPAFAMVASFNPTGDTYPTTVSLYFVPAVTQANQPLTINWSTTNVYSIRLTATGLDSGIITTLGSGSYSFPAGFPATTLVTLSGFDIIGNPIITVTAFALVTGGFGLNFGSVFTS